MLTTGKADSPKQPSRELVPRGTSAAQLSTCCAQRNCRSIQDELANGLTAKSCISNIWFWSKKIFVGATNYVLYGQDRVTSSGSLQGARTSTAVEGKTTTFCIVARCGRSRRLIVRSKSKRLDVCAEVGRENAHFAVCTRKLQF